MPLWLLVAGTVTILGFAFVGLVTVFTWLFDNFVDYGEPPEQPLVETRRVYGLGGTDYRQALRVVGPLPKGRA